MAHIVSRVLIGAVVVATLVAMVLVAVDGLRSAGSLPALQWVPIIESTVNDLVFAGIAVVFLHAFPGRLARADLLALLHRLRSLAHIIDMHQLTKYPERLHPDFRPTDETKPLGLSAIDLANYLDYCSEMLSLVGKAAALCAEGSTDAVVLDTVSTIETITTGMSQKIGQKISLLPPSA